MEVDLAKGIYDRRIEHGWNISKAKKASGYKHPISVRKKISESVKRIIASKK